MSSKKFPFGGELGSPRGGAPGIAGIAGGGAPGMASMSARGGAPGIAGIAGGGAAAGIGGGAARYFVRLNAEE